MSITKISLVTVFLLAVIAPAAPAQQGGGGGFGAGNFGGSFGANSVPMSGGSFPMPGFYPADTTTAPQRFRELTVVGKIPADEKKLPDGARLVRLRVNGREVSMALDSEERSADLTFEPHQRYARELYHAILTKRVEVTGDASLRDRIVWSAEHNQPVEIQGYVFNFQSPYMVVKAVGPPR
jgi:hypothetical protein